METSKDKRNKLNSQVMALRQLISAPLIATLDADAMTTRSYIDFLREVAFERDTTDGETGLGKLRTFTFQYTQSESGRRILKSVQIPVISLIPIPLLQIQEAVFDFEIKILDAVSEVKEDSYSFDGQPIDKDTDDNPVSMRASLAPQSGSSKNQKDHSQTANMKVKVVMHQADMPSGLANLLSLSANNMTVESTDNEDEYVRPDLNENV